MAILIDPPRWPAHGTRWSHLVSDTSYEELHEFARLLPLPRRAFDIDHYDVPESQHARAVALGAEPVTGVELVRALVASGLRQSKLRRPEVVLERRREYLRDEWLRLGVALERAGEGWQRLGRELVERWSEAHRAYHDLRHLEDVLLAVDHLEVLGEPIAPSTLLAAWFHDAVYRGAPDDEHDSAMLARERMRGLGLERALADEVAEFILATAPGRAPEAAPLPLVHLLDADLAVLGAGERRYRDYTRAVRAEYGHVEPEAFRTGRRSILQGFLAQPRIYRSDPGHRLWEERARRNLAEEIAALAR